MQTLYSLNSEIDVVLEQVGVVEVKNKDLKIDVQGKEVKVSYATEAGAEAARDDLIAAITAANPPPGLVNVGDRLWLIPPDTLEKQWGRGFLVVIAQVKTDEHPYWVFVSETGKPYIWELEATFQQLPPLDP